MAGPARTRRLGTACRIYKNAVGDVIALDSIEVVVNTLEKADRTFYRSVNKIDVSRRLIHLSAGASRAVATVVAMGTYSSVEENGGNYLILTWDKSSDNENNVVISLENKVAVIGDTV